MHKPDAIQDWEHLEKLQPSLSPTGRVGPNQVWADIQSSISQRGKNDDTNDPKWNCFAFLLLQVGFSTNIKYQGLG